MTILLPKRFSSSMPAITNRQASCTHVTMTRVFDNNGSLKCDICKKSPDLGWLYACTEDQDRDSPREEYPGSSLGFSFSTKTPQKIDVSLSGWIIKAIGEGHYTEQQIETIKMQRLKVQETIEAMGNWK